MIGCGIRQVLNVYIFVQKSVCSSLGCNSMVSTAANLINLVFIFTSLAIHPFRDPNEILEQGEIITQNEAEGEQLR